MALGTSHFSYSVCVHHALVVCSRHLETPRALEVGVANNSETADSRQTAVVKLAEENLESLVAVPRTPEHAKVTNPQQRAAYNRTVKVAIALALVLTFAIIIASLVINMQTKASNLASCDYNFCLPYKAMMERHAEGTINTCNNIYRVACDRWAISGLHSKYRNGMDQFIRKAATQLASAKLPSTGAFSSSEKATRFFQSCQDSILLGVSQLDRLVGYLENVDVTWPRIPEHPDVLATMARLRLTFDLDTLLAIMRNEGRGTHHLTVGPCDWLGGHGKTMRDMVEVIETTYKSLASGLLPQSCPNASCRPVPLSGFKTLANTVYGFVGSKNFQVGSYLSDVKTLSRLTTAFEKHRWERVFGSVFNLSHDMIVIEMTSYEYMDAFSSLVRQVGEQSIHYFVGWLALLELAPFVDSNIATAHYLGRRYLLTAITPFACLQRTELFFGLATYSGLMRTISPATLELAKTISSDIHKHLLHRLKQRPEWAGLEGLLVDISGDINDLNRSSALLDEHFKNAPLIGDKFIENWVLLVKSGFSQHKMRSSRFSAGFTFQRVYNGLQPCDISHGTWTLPLFVHELRLLKEFSEPAENYGRFGVYAAMTMLANFLNNVSKNVAWNELFANATSCFRALGVRPQDEKQISIRAQALQIAFEAFVNTMSSTTSVWRARLGKQIFFLSFASLWCTHFHPNHSETDINNMCHMIPGFFSVYDCTREALPPCFFL